MTRSIRHGIMVALLLVWNVAAANALPMAYTFEGSPKQLLDWGANYVSEAGIDYDSKLTYTFVFDFERQGYRTLFNGTILFFDDVGPIINGYEGTFDYFFTEYVGGDAFLVKFSGRTHSDLDFMQHNWGNIQDWENTDVYSDNIFIRAGWGDEQLYLSQGRHSIADPPVDLTQSFALGSTWELNNQIDTGAGVSLVRADVTLVAISPVKPVPEANTGLLLGSGLIGLLAMGYRRKAKK